MKGQMSLQDVNEIRDAYERFYSGTIGGKFVPPVSMVNNGYLHNLNASFDGILLRESKATSLLEPQQPVNFGTIQPCVRNEDQRLQRSSPLHLSLFEILGCSKLDFKSMSPQTMAEKTIDEFMRLYTHYLGLDPTLLKIYYFGGGTLREVSKGKITNDQYIERDNFSKLIWARHGLDNLVAEHSNETFLLHLGEPIREHHSGYRNDIFMKVGNTYFEIATLNFISHQTRTNGKGDLVGISPLPFYLREMAVGQERILAAMQGSNDLYKLPFTAPLVKSVSRVLSGEEAKVLVDALRVVHYVISDGWTYDKLRGSEHARHRHELNGYFRMLSDACPVIDRQKFRDLLNHNAQLQPWYPKLTSNVDQVVATIAQYEKRQNTSRRV